MPLALRVTLEPWLQVRWARPVRIVDDLRAVQVEVCELPQEVSVEAEGRAGAAHATFSQHGGVQPREAPS